MTEFCDRGSVCQNIVNKNWCLRTLRQWAHFVSERFDTKPVCQNSATQDLLVTVLWLWVLFLKKYVFGNSKNKNFVRNTLGNLNPLIHLLAIYLNKLAIMARKIRLHDRSAH